MTNKRTIMILFTGFLLCILPLSPSLADSELVTDVNPSQGGMVMPQCFMGCWYTDAQQVTLLAVPFPGYVFSGWSGDCSGLNPGTTISMNMARNCTANFVSCSDKPVQIGATEYQSLTDAYGASVSNDVLKLLAANFLEGLQLNRPVDIILKGGYGCGYSSVSSSTLVAGPLVISNGSVVLDNVVLVTAPVAPPIPKAPPASGFDNVINDPAVSGDIKQIAMGTTGKDLITQYGGTGNTGEVASGGGGNDWIFQQCGGTQCFLSASIGDGDGTVYQFAAGGGLGKLSAIGGTSGVQTFIQSGGKGLNIMLVDDSANTGTSHIEMYGGPSGNIMEVTGSHGDDLVIISGGGGNDFIVYNISDGNDVALINGGGGRDTLTVNTGGETNYTIKNGSGSMVFSSGSGGTQITVVDIQGVVVLDNNGNTLYSSGFDTVTVHTLISGDTSQIDTGTSGRDLIIQYGGTGNTTEIANGGAGDDWFFQRCFSGAGCTERILTGDGNDVAYQYVTGGGTSNITAIGGNSGAQTFIQVGGLGTNSMTVNDSLNGNSGDAGSAHIEMYGGPSGNTMEATGSMGNDIVMIYGGAGGDTITYNVTAGNDVVYINGVGGNDNVTINAGDQTNYSLKNGSGSVLFASGNGGTAITIEDVDQITVLGYNGTPVFAWP